MACFTRRPRKTAVLRGEMDVLLLFCDKWVMVFNENAFVLLVTFINKILVAIHSGMQDD